ncbi:MAG: hypothetical protein U0K92_03065 [Treponema sp.]|nr:hypothetical protein [Treponema sp.]
MFGLQADSSFRMEMIAEMKIRVPYNLHHFVMGSMYGSILYNPANTTGKIDDFNAVYVRNK